MINISSLKKELKEVSEKEMEKEYEALLEQGRMKIIEVNDRIMKFQKIAEKSNGSKKKKYQFLVKINLSLLSEMISALKNNELVDLAWENATFYRYLFPRRNPFDVWGLQYDDMDWRCRINFLKMSVSKCGKMQELYNSNSIEDRCKYLEEFDQYIKEYGICDEIKSLIRKIYVSRNRVCVIDDAIELYKNNRHLSFINLAAIQIEGLFGDYLQELEIEKELPSIYSKVELLKEETQVWGYTYYAFEFPEIRNKIAHGGILDEDLKEKSMELLTDIYNILASIAEADSLYRKIINFLRAFLITKDKVQFFLEEWIKIERELCEKNKSNKYGQLFTRLAKGEFKDRIKWEKCEKEAFEFIEFLKKDTFWNGLLIEEYDNYMGELKEFFRVNKEYIFKEQHEYFKMYEDQAKKRMMDYFGEDWCKFYLPHKVKKG